VHTQINVSTQEEVFFSPSKGFFFRTQTADLWRSPVPALLRIRALYLYINFFWNKPARNSSSSAPGKRDKYRYEVECVTDVPIGCILNR
jgi:hypothetical protein